MIKENFAWLVQKCQTKLIQFPSIESFIHETLTTIKLNNSLINT